ncbi:MAG: hypothetical protein Q9195_009456 [Heterodermia aff. obscurata]
MRPLRTRHIHIMARLAVVRWIGFEAAQQLDDGVEAAHGGAVRDVEVGGDVLLEDLGEELPAVLVDDDGEEVDDLLDFDDAGGVGAG